LTLHRCLVLDRISSGGGDGTIRPDDL